MGRVWHTPAGVALAVSIILRPDPEELSAIGMAGAVSVAELCLAYDLPDVTIKWPNDVRVGGKKVCGILPEAVWVGDELIGAILGIGVNVRVSFTGELAQTATNLEMAASRTLDRAQLAADLIGRVVYWSRHFSGEMLFQRWRALLDTPGNVVRIGNLEGLAVDVDRSGALLLQRQDGQVERVIAGDVMLVER
jgi:BirA family biotin operon repressor/biotin-[acetyl-CoA-carboxylase] ligase